ncbi:MAG: Hpt domain-containing protein [Phycisphaerales bacterium]|nr:Hpt domain-containing protein [Phycisphaerales bacterium]
MEERERSQGSVGGAPLSASSLFQTALLEMLPGLRAGVRSGAWDAVWRIAHRLGGSAGMLGRGDISRPVAAFQAAWVRAKGPEGVKAGTELVESAEALVRACERALPLEAA